MDHRNDAAFWLEVADSGVGDGDAVVPQQQLLLLLALVPALIETEIETGLRDVANAEFARPSTRVVAGIEPVTPDAAWVVAALGVLAPRANQDCAMYGALV